MSYCRWPATRRVWDAGDVYTTWVNNGEMFDDPTLAQFKERLLQLQARGLRVPDRAFERIDGELAAPDVPPEEK
jgi:hypothetical protein